MEPKTITVPKTALWSATLLLLLFFACRQPQFALPYDTAKSSTAASAMVVSPHPLASEVGRAVLRQGGSAVDAAVAVQFALAVVYPRAGNIGGGGLMVIRQSDGSTDALDYREKAPLRAHRDMYLDTEGQVVQGLSVAGHLAAGVPGTVDGLLAAHQKYGRLPLADLIDPAIALAAQGFAVTETEAKRLSSFQADFRQHNPSPNAFTARPAWAAGDRLAQKDLARTLRRIRDRGRAGFYEGETARLIMAEMARGGGIISAADLQGYQAQWRAPVTGTYKDYRIISMPPPSSGGIALVQLLKMVEPYPLAQWGFHSPQSTHLMAEAARRVYADRATYLGDSDFYQVPIDSLLRDSYLRSRMADFSPTKATVSAAVGAGNFRLSKESFETTHTSVVDASGNAVSVTTTLNSNYGCKVVVAGAGFFLNNEMDDFSVKTGVPNQFGLIGNEANAIAPSKRMLSSMTPTIIERNGELFMVLGAPGGSTIITAVFQVFLNVAEFGMDLPAAVAAPRFHHQWLPDQILAERSALSPSTRAALAQMGHQIQDVSALAVVKAILRTPNGQLQGAGDPRNPDDDARGY